MTDYTEGEKRVGVSFNPSKKPDVVAAEQIESAVMWAVKSVVRPKGYVGGLPLWVG